MSSGIAVEALRKVYRAPADGTHLVLDHVSFSARPGETVGLLGPARAGKTVALRVIAGRARPTSGHICVDGHDLSANRRMALRRLRAILEGSIDMQMLKTAESSVLILDEPAIHLDAIGQQVLAHTLDYFTRERGGAVLLATRRLHVAAAICDRVVLLDGGRILGEYSRADLPSLFGHDVYRIRVAGRIEEHWTDWLGGLSLSYTGPDSNETVLAGPLRDQGALHGVLNKLRDLAVPLLTVDRVELDVESGAGERILSKQV